MNYQKFIENKIVLAGESGIKINDADINPMLKPHQRDITKWAILGGRRAGLDEGREVSRTGIEFTDRSQWSNFVWLPCADGKVRRAPDDSFGLVDGLHRSLLGALGNSIVPQVAYEIIKAINETDS